MKLRRRHVLLAVVAVVIFGALTVGISRIFLSDAGRDLTTADVVTALHSAGQLDAAVVKRSDWERYAVIAPQGWTNVRGWSEPLYAVWFSSASQASRTYTQGYSPSALASQLAEARKHPDLYRGLIPKGFPNGVRTERVCNVILVSNNPSHRAALAREIDRTAELLRAKCT